MDNLNRCSDGDPAVASLLAWHAELSGLDPRSHQYRHTAQLLADLAFEAGVLLPAEMLGPAPADQDAPNEVPVPPAFASAVLLDAPVEVPAEQFRLIPLLCRPDKTYVVEATELGTDDGRVVRLVDLRPQTAAQLDDVRPTADDAARLDSHFYHDLHQMVERGKARNVVRRQHGGSGPCYTRIVGKKTRSFWAPVQVVESGGEHVLTVARIADCGARADQEVKAYRRLFGLTMRGIK
jgi:hypothetical protein